MNNVSICINSEIGPLKKVMLHRPSRELERITPKDLNNVLFEDIPWLKKMQIEHDGFAQTLRDNGCQVYYFEDCLREVLLNESAKNRIISDILDNEVQYDQYTIDALKVFLSSLDNVKLSQYILGGISRDEINIHHKSLIRFMPEDYIYYFPPLPNAYFMRDPAVIVGKGILQSVMDTPIRHRESRILNTLHSFHPLFKDVPVYYDNDLYKMSIEGGDVFILSKDTICIGCSERTSAYAIEVFAKSLFKKDQNFKQVIVVQIPHVRSFMHLDTVFTMVDQDKFIIYPGIRDSLKVVTIERTKNEEVRFITDRDLITTLEITLHTDYIKLIDSGGDNPITAEREQWNDSTNTLAIAPGIVITYDRNEITNDILRKNNIQVIEIEGGELVRGRGGPRCMSMPLLRKDF